MENFDDLTGMGKEILDTLYENFGSNPSPCYVSELNDILADKHKNSCWSDKSKHAWSGSLSSLTRKGYIRRDHTYESPDFSKEHPDITVLERGIKYFEHLEQKGC